MLAYIQQYIEAEQYPPTIREIRAALDLSSTSLVFRDLDKLTKQGLIEVRRRAARGIRLLDRLPV